MVIFQC